MPGKTTKERIMDPQADMQLEDQISALIADLGDEDLLTRQHARLLLVHIGHKSVPALLEALKSHNSRARREAVQTLGAIRDPDTGTALTTMLTDEDTGVRWTAMESLIHLGRASLRPILERLTQDFDSPWLRRGVHHILHVFKDRQELNELEITLFEILDRQNMPGFESGWVGDEAYAAARALEALNAD
jgi:HEAT repeat protein